MASGAKKQKKWKQLLSSWENFSYNELEKNKLVDRWCCKGNGGLGGVGEYFPFVFI